MFERIRTFVTTMSDGAVLLVGASLLRGHLILARLFARESIMPNLIRRFLGDTSGATAIEYGMIAGLISVVIIGTLTTLGTSLKAKFNAIATRLS